MSTIKVDTIVDEDGSGAPNFTHGATGIAGLTPSIDDNGNATAITIDSSEVVHVGGTSESGTGQVSLNGSGYVKARKNGTTGIFDRITTDGTILDLRKDGSTVGSIKSAFSSSIAIDGATNRSGLYLATSSLVPRYNASNIDATVDLGAASTRFKDAYLSGGVYLGGTGSANKLDDYEEGTWTPRLSDNGVNFASVSTTGSYYTKIGNLVTISARLFNINTSGLTGGNNIRIDNLPFSPPSSGNYDNYAAVFADRVSFSSSGDYMVAVLSGDSGFIRLFAPDSGLNDLIVNVSDIISTGSDIAFTMQYTAA